MITATIVHLDDGGDLSEVSFESIEAANEFLSNLEYKAILVSGENLKVRNRT